MRYNLNIIGSRTQQNSIGNGQDVQIPQIIPTVHQSEALRRYLIIAPPNPIICHFQWRQDKESVMLDIYLAVIYVNVTLVMEQRWWILSQTALGSKLSPIYS